MEHKKRKVLVLIIALFLLLLAGGLGLRLLFLADASGQTGSEEPVNSTEFEDSDRDDPVIPNLDGLIPASQQTSSSDNGDNVNTSGIPENKNAGHPGNSDGGDNQSDNKDSGDSPPQNDNPDSTDQNGDDNTNNGAGGNSGGSGGYVSQPKAQIDFELPAVAHTDTSITVVTTLQYTKSLTWSLTEAAADGTQLPISLTDAVEGSLEQNGGVIVFKEKGSYTLTATAVNNSGKETVLFKSISVYPVIDLSFDLPETTYTDKAVTVTTVADLGDLNITWTVAENSGKSETVEWDNVTDGILTNSGGTITFKKKGDYTLTATVTDVTGRSFAHNESIKVFPVAGVSYELPATAHTDTTLNLATTQTEMEGLTVVWGLTRNGEKVTIADSIDGSLTNDGGCIRFIENGLYALTATITDAIGRVFETTATIMVYPVGQIEFYLPEITHTDAIVRVETSFMNMESAEADWTLAKDGVPVVLGNYIEGELTNDGGLVRFKAKGTYSLTASFIDQTGRNYSYSQSITVYPVPVLTFTLPASVHTGTAFSVVMNNASELEEKNIVWTLTRDDTPAGYTGSLTNSGGSIAIGTTGTYTLTATVTDETGRTFSYSGNIKITNTAPNAPTASATVTRTVNDGKFLVNLTATASDPDGDAVTYEYTGNSQDSYYAVGAHEVRVRSKDACGLYSDWTIVRFTVVNSAPSTPVITRTPSGNSVAPSTNVTITAASSDADGDRIAYVWEGRPSETATYPLGKNTVKVKAVDATGAESSWAAIVFFVADSNSGGGMTLSGPESVILEQGIAGATISDYTFTVPPVAGHSGSDYGRVRGYNILTGQWDQLDYQTTSNGITFTRTLTPGVYSQLEFYYYTNHNCMYNKSNITYSVTYYFE